MKTLYHAELVTAREYFEGKMDEPSEQVWVDAVVEAFGTRFFNDTDVGFAEFYSRIDWSTSKLTVTTAELGLSDAVVDKLRLESVYLALADAGYLFTYNFSNHTGYITITVPKLEE